MTVVHAVVAVKGSARGKHRLAGALTEAQRQLLIQTMLSDVLDALRGTHAIASINVLTQDAALLPDGIGHITDGGLGLNAAVTHAAVVLSNARAESMLILPADLPFVTSEDIAALIAAGQDHCAVIAPDVRRLGTNALLLTPPDLIAPAFGEHSFTAHIDAVHVAMGQRIIHSRGLQIVMRPGLAHDIDRPADLRALVDKPDGRYRFLDAALRKAS